MVSLTQWARTKNGSRYRTHAWLIKFGSLTLIGYPLSSPLRDEMARPSQDELQRVIIFKTQQPLDLKALNPTAQVIPIFSYINPEQPSTLLSLSLHLWRRNPKKNFPQFPNMVRDLFPWNLNSSSSYLFWIFLIWGTLDWFTKGLVWFFFFGDFLVTRFFQTISIFSILRQSWRRRGTSSNVSCSLQIPSSWYFYFYFFFGEVEIIPILYLTHLLLWFPNFFAVCYKLMIQGAYKLMIEGSNSKTLLWGPPSNRGIGSCLCWLEVGWQTSIRLWGPPWCIPISEMEAICMN